MLFAAGRQVNYILSATVDWLTIFCLPQVDGGSVASVGPLHARHSSRLPYGLRGSHSNAAKLLTMMN